MKSMTGYGAAEGKVGRGRVFVEVRSVNHRYSEIYFRIPPKFNVLEPKVRKAIQTAIARGKVDCFCKEVEPVEPLPKAVVNLELARTYKRCLRELTQALGIPPHDLLDVVSLKELIRLEEQPVRYERYWREVAAVVQKALQQLDAMRRREGTHLQRDQQQRLTRLLAHIEKIRERTRQRQAAASEAVSAAVARGASPEGVRQNLEATAAANDRADITEELVRFESHAVQYRRFLGSAEPVGRQLDFLLQELHREINTMGSKAGDVQIAQMVVVVKSELEKMREQAQNIE